MNQRGSIALILLIVIIGLSLAVAAYFIAKNNGVSTTSTTPYSSSQPESAYQNPFTEDQTYSNPFNETTSYENPFENL